jgi:UTP--glucose-1-phosphate uridylyltransferase
MKIRKAVITAAGWGTRFLPLSKSVPKELLPLVDKPIIQYAVEEAVACGIELVVIVISQGKTAIENYFMGNAGLEHVLEQKKQGKLLESLHALKEKVDFCFVPQMNIAGLGHAVLSTKSVIGDDPFVVILPDDLFERGDWLLRQMIDISGQYESSVVALRKVEQNEISRYGIVEVEEKEASLFQVRNLVEKPKPAEAPSNLAMMGRYILMPEIFSALESTSPGWGGEIQLTDGLKQLLKKQKIFGYQIPGKYYDAGTIPGWIETTVAFALQHPEYGPLLKDKFFSD